MNPPSTPHPPRGRRPTAGAPSPAETGLDALEWAVSSGAATDVMRRAATARRQRLRRRVAGGLAALSLCAVSAWLVLKDARAIRDPGAPPASAVVIAPETLTLADGSVVELGTGAAIAVAYSPAARRVVLRAGEAHFQVRPDSARPFVVDAAGVEVRAVGTAFLVDLGQQRVDVVVTEGRVAVTSAPAGAAREVGPPPALVAAGQQVAVPLDAASPGPVRPLAPAEQRDRLGWRVPLLEFSATPLAEAVTLFNRHGGQRLALDPALGHLRLSGTLRADDLESLLTLLRSEFGITSTPIGDSDRIELRR